jgi:hypothetical protein
MELQTEKLEEYQLINLKNLSTKKTELIYNIGELYLELSELKKIILGAETEYKQVSVELDTLLNDLNQKYPNGEIDLNEGSVTFQK